MNIHFSPVWFWSTVRQQPALLLHLQPHTALSSLHNKNLIPAGNFIFHPPVEIYNLDHRTGDAERRREKQRKECGCLKTDNPFQGFPTGRFCCVALLICFQERSCFAPLALPATGLWWKWHWRGRLLIWEKMEDINSAGELGGFLSECPRVQMALLALQSRLSIIWITIIDSSSLWLLWRGKWPLQFQSFSRCCTCPFRRVLKYVTVNDLKTECNSHIAYIIRS